jgi:hypothetical protein
MGLLFAGETLAREVSSWCSLIELVCKKRFQVLKKCVIIVIFKVSGNLVEVTVLDTPSTTPGLLGDRFAQVKEDARPGSPGGLFRVSAGTLPLRNVE